MTTLYELPADTDAERIVVGTAIDSPMAARLVANLQLADLTVGVHRRLWRAAVRCPLPYRYDGARTRAVAEAAGVDFEVAEELRTAAPVLYDTGYFADRVRDATRRRRVLAEAAAVHDLLAAGGQLDEAQAALERALAVATGEAVGILADSEALAQ